MQLRSYQLRIVQAVLAGGNSIVLLPTGAGKTLIAAEVIRTLGGACVFLVPTCLLVKQQAQAIRAWTQQDVGEYMGGAVLPQRFDILVSTPKAFQIAQAKTSLLAWSQFKLVVFDEVHHVLKDHPYRKLAQQLCKCDGPVVLGLTASLTYAVGEKKVQGDVSRICRELQVRVLETATQAELEASGYHCRAAAPELAEIPSLVPENVVPEADRKPHLMGKIFFARLAAGSSTEFAQKLFGVVTSMEKALAADPSFQSPLKASSKTWGSYAHNKADRSPMYGALEHWYEALRVLLNSWEEAQDAAAAYLEMTGQRRLEASTWPAFVDKSHAEFWRACPEIWPRHEHLKEVLEHKFDALVATHGEFRGILFVQQRVMTHILEHVIRDAGLKQFTPACLYATSSPATSSLAVSSAQSQARLKAFASGAVNLLITTVVAEEGMDVPAANCVIRFDPMVNSVSLVQGRGRARQEGSAFVVLSERPDRPTAVLAEVEQQQLEICRSFQPGDVGADPAKEKAAQTSRERNAAAVLAKPGEALANLNLFCKKTKVELQEDFLQAGGWCCRLAYLSVLRSTTAEGTASSRKEAKKKAAEGLLAELQKSLA
ncbi:unnamed protein product [Effrenium voratum]|nr:unnamed protein product [Effrenium voratum]